MQIDASDKQALLGLGRLLVNAGQSNEAIAAYQTALESVPEDTSLHLALAEAYAAEASADLVFRWTYYDFAEDEYRQVLALDPQNARAYAGLGSIYREQERWAEAAAAYGSALDLEPDNAGYHLSLGRVYKDQGHLDDAIAYYQEAVRLDPTNGWYCRVLGDALGEQGACAEAIAVYVEASQLEPSYLLDPYYHKSLGRCYRLAERLDEAIVALETAKRLEPDAHGIRYELALAYLVAGQTEKAIAEFEAVAEMVPDTELGEQAAELARLLREP